MLPASWSPTMNKRPWRVTLGSELHHRRAWAKQGKVPAAASAAGKPAEGTGRSWHLRFLSSRCRPTAWGMLMLESLLRADRPAPATFDTAMLGALERASGAIARLDQALDHHPLQTAFLYRARLEAVRRQASVDGHGIDPWHLAAVLEGLRLRMDHALRIVDRGQIFRSGAQRAHAASMDRRAGLRSGRRNPGSRASPGQRQPGWSVSVRHCGHGWTRVGPGRRSAALSYGSGPKTASSGRPSRSPVPAP